MAPVDLSTSPWLIRIFDRVPLSLVVMGMLIAIAHFLLIALLGLLLSPTLAGEFLVWGGLWSGRRHCSLDPGRIYDGCWLLRAPRSRA